MHSVLIAKEPAAVAFCPWSVSGIHALGVEKGAERLRPIAEPAEVHDELAAVAARSIKRVASTVGEGSMAVSLIHQHLWRDERTRCAIYSECRGKSGHS